MAPKPPARWNPSKGSPFARAAFPPGGGYRPQSIHETTGVNTFGAPSAPIGAGPVAQSNPGPPVSWQGQWRPTEAELARWGGRAVLYGPAVPDHAQTVDPLDILDATLPWPMGVDCAIAIEGLAAWTTAIDVMVQSGVGRASWTDIRVIQPAVGTSTRIDLFRTPLRQITVRARFNTTLGPPAAGEVVSVSFGFGIVGV